MRTVWAWRVAKDSWGPWQLGSHFMDPTCCRRLVVEVNGKQENNQQRNNNQSSTHQSIALCSRFWLRSWFQPEICLVMKHVILCGHERLPKFPEEIQFKRINFFTIWNQQTTDKREQAVSMVRGKCVDSSFPAIFFCDWLDTSAIIESNAFISQV